MYGVVMHLRDNILPQSTSGIRHVIFNEFHPESVHVSLHKNIVFINYDVPQKIVDLFDSDGNCTIHPFRYSLNRGTVLHYLQIFPKKPSCVSTREILQFIHENYNICLINKSSGTYYLLMVTIVEGDAEFMMKESSKDTVPFCVSMDRKRSRIDFEASSLVSVQQANEFLESLDLPISSHDHWTTRDQVECDNTDIQLKNHIINFSQLLSTLVKHNEDVIDDAMLQNRKNNLTKYKKNKQYLNKLVQYSDMLKDNMSS